MASERMKQTMHPVLNGLLNSTRSFLCSTTSYADGKRHPSKRHVVNDSEWVPAPAERRATERFPMELRLRYQTRWPALLGIVGRGNTVDISSKGVLFAADKTVRPGTRMELVVDWPAKLRGEVPVELVMYGTVVRSQIGNVPLIALSAARYSFRTSR